MDNDKFKNEFEKILNEGRIDDEKLKNFQNNIKDELRNLMSEHIVKMPKDQIQKTLWCNQYVEESCNTLVKSGNDLYTIIGILDLIKTKITKQYLENESKSDELWSGKDGI